jgi:hypothetical protein
MKKNNALVLIVLALLITIFLPSLVHQGMFLDGITYSAISKNLASGIGSCFAPHYTKILFPSFYEHPPLVFIIQSYFFLVLGDGFYTEKLFSLVVILFTVYGIVLCWRLLSEGEAERNNYWIPILFWLIIPIVAWSYKNNLLENVTGLFSLFAVYFLLSALIYSRNLLLFPASLFIFFAFLSKGFVGLFPIAVPFVYGALYGSRKKAIFNSLVIIVCLFCFFVGMYLLFPELIINLKFYLNQQLLPALQNKREITTSYRFKLIFDLLLDLSIPIILLIGFWYYEWKNHVKIIEFKNKKFLLFIFIALTASIPLIISLKQRKFYLIPSIPFYALSFGFLLHQAILVQLNKLPEISFKIIKYLSYGLIGFIFVYSIFSFGNYSRDKEILKDIQQLSKHIPEGSILSTSQDLCNDWALIAYLSRFGYLSLDCSNEHKFLLLDRNSNKNISDKFKLLDLKLSRFKVYQIEEEVK